MHNTRLLIIYPVLYVYGAIYTHKYALRVSEKSLVTLAVFRMLHVKLYNPDAFPGLKT